MTTNIDIDNGMHDGSPLGNAPLGSERYIELALCPDKGCPGLNNGSGGYFKCYKPCFETCLTRVQREKDARDIGFDENSELVVRVSE